jgi:hypothetical protein
LEQKDEKEAPAAAAERWLQIFSKTDNEIQYDVIMKVLK